MDRDRMSRKGVRYALAIPPVLYGSIMLCIAIIAPSVLVRLEESAPGLILFMNGPMILNMMAFVFNEFRLYARSKSHYRLWKNVDRKLYMSVLILCAVFIILAFLAKIDAENRGLDLFANRFDRIDDSLFTIFMMLPLMVQIIMASFADPDSKSNIRGRDTE